MCVNIVEFWVDVNSQDLQESCFLSWTLTLCFFREFLSLFLKGHNEKYNYQSSWHRDAKFANLENIVAIIYLRDENGFRLVPKNLENEMIENSPFSKEKNYKHGYTNLPKKYFHQFDAKAGDIVIFDAGLLHQGSCKGKRTHLFARLIEDPNNNNPEENAPKIKYFNPASPENSELRL